MEFVNLVYFRRKQNFQITMFSVFFFSVVNVLSGMVYIFCFVRVMSNQMPDVVALSCSFGEVFN